MIDKPAFLTEEHLTFLDDLHESDATNMFGAARYLEREFDLKKQEARDVLSYWMKTFSERHKVKET